MSWLKLSSAVAVVTLAAVAVSWGPVGVAADAKTESTPDSAGWIGVMLDENGRDGATVTKVFPAGPAAVGGVRVGDKIVAVGGRKVSSAKSLVQAVEQLKPGSQAAVTVVRDGQSVDLGMIIGSLHEFHKSYAHEMMRRDPRDPNSAKFAGISEADMNAEMFRRLMEQNQRLETMLQAVHQEVKELREEVRQLKK